MTTPIRIGIAGITGRMGRETAALALADPRVELIGGTSRSGDPVDGWPGLLITHDPGLLAGGIDCLIDLSAPEAVAENAGAAARHRVALLCGVTGLGHDEVGALRAASESIPVHWSRNLSRGIPEIAAILRQLAAALADFDVEITETHHRGKRDAPSGTALLLAEAIAEGRKLQLEKHATYGRYGESPRQPGEIGIHALRAGALPGEHTVLFAGEEEEIRISHRALTRTAFARGAIEAAIVLRGQPNGFQIT